MLGSNVTSFSYGWTKKLLHIMVTVMQQLGSFKEAVYSDQSHAHCITSMWHCHAENNLMCIDLTQISWLFSMISHYILGYL